MITFYDHDSNFNEKSWNTHSWKTRLSLNYKGLPYQTVWVEYPDIEDMCKRIRAPPSTTERKPNGDPKYILPVIFDDLTGVVVSDSFLIAEYLDKTYPGLPTLIPKGTRAMHLAVRDANNAKLLRYGLFTMVAATAYLSARSVAHLRKTWEPVYGMKLEEVLPPPGSTERTVAWAKWKEAVGELDAWMRKDDAWIMGDTMSFADFEIATHILSAGRFFGKDSLEWKDVLQWHNGRWARLAKNLEPYSQIV